MSREAYIFRGAPASGKGTIVPEFCKSLSQPVALIEQDKFRWGIHMFGREIADVTDEEHRLANRAVVATYKEYLKAGLYAVVVEGLFTWDDTSASQGNAQELISLAGSYGYECHSILLRAAKQELLKRNTAREYSVPLEEFESLYDGVYSTIGPDEIICDSTQLTPNQTLELLTYNLA